MTWGATKAAALAAALVLSTPTHTGVEGASPFWQLQTTTDCEEQAVRIAVDTLTGHQITQTQIDAYAASIGALRPGVGSVWAQTPNLLREYGLNATPPRATSRVTLRRELANGNMIIAAVNAETIWAPAHKWTNGPDHAVIIWKLTDRSVTLIDTGTPNGNGEVVPWHRFSRAWAASDWSAVIASK